MTGNSGIWIFQGGGCDRSTYCRVGNAEVRRRCDMSDSMRGRGGEIGRCMVGWDCEVKKICLGVVGLRAVAVVLRGNVRVSEVGKK